MLIVTGSSRHARRLLGRGASGPPTPAAARARPRAAGPLVALAVLCGAHGLSAPPPVVAQPDASPELLVLAAASLTDVLPRIAERWSAVDGASVRFSFDGTSRLAPQAVSGARADLFFAADEAWIRWLEGEGAVARGSARVIATNELVLIVHSGAPHPRSPDELGGLDRVALANENVPAGRYGRSALASAGVWDRVAARVVRGGSVRGVLEWVARGEVPAGIVYRTDALVEPGVEIAFAFPAAGHDPIEYWAAPLATAELPRRAAAFLEYVGGPEGRAILTAAGFGEPAGDRPAQIDRAPPPLAGPSVGSAIRLSLLVALLATALGLVPAVGLGWVLARLDFPGKALLSTLVLVPLVIPPVVTGFLLLSALGTQSPLGRLLESLGLPVPFTLLGATVAAFVVGFPLYVISVRGAFEAVDPLYEELSETLGIPPRRTFLRVSLPLALPGIAAGAVLAFARALGEFGATIVLAGNVEGSTRTIALAVYTLLESPAGREATWVLVGASVALSLLALLGYETLSRRQKQRLEDHHAR